MKYTQELPSSGARPAGEYPFTVSDAQDRVSNSSGNEMIELVLEIKGGAPVYDYLVNTKDSWYKINDFLAAIGGPITPGKEVNINPDDFIGKTGRCRLYIDEFQGKQRNKVGEYVIPDRPATGIQPKKDDWR
jgi:hypothetical protein